MRSVWRIVSIMCVVGMLAGCVSSGRQYRVSTKPYTVNGQTYYPVESGNGYSETGQASWYGTKFHGRRTASGDIYDQNKMTAAHKTLPFGTRVRVTNIDNNKTADVIVNDRGPFVRGRIIDVSRGAAKKLGMISSGVANVKIQTIK